MAFDQIQVTLLDAMGSDLSIAGAAWASSYNFSPSIVERDPNGRTRAEALVVRLINDGHTSPLESVVFRFHARWPIFVDRQHVTHRIQSSNGLSGRYRTLPNDWYGAPDDVVEILCRTYEGSAMLEEYRHELICQHVRYSDWLSRLKQQQTENIISNADYKRCREVLRGVIGTSGMTERVFIINLHSLSNYFRLRLSEHAQPEIRNSAEKMLAEVVRADVAPVAIKTLMERGWKTQ